MRPSYPPLCPLFVAADEFNDKYREWSLIHIDKFLRCIFGGAQYKVATLSYLPLTNPKVGTELCATEDKGMIPAPDFARILFKDRCYP
jgi:hypothetical protein